MDASNYIYTNYYVNPSYLTKEVKGFIKELIIDYRYSSYRNFAESDKAKLASILSKLDGTLAEVDFISESDQRYLMDLLRKYTLTESEIDGKNFATEMRNSLITYYDQTMKNIFLYYQDSIMVQDPLIDDEAA